MSIPPTRSLQQLTNDALAAFVAELDPSLGVTVAGIPKGDPARALAFMGAALAVYLQGQVQGLVGYARAGTSVGADLASWQADFGFTAPPGASAQVSITLPTSNGQAATAALTIPAGTILQTQPIVVAPSTVPSVYSFSTNVDATIPIGGTSVAVLCTATQPGSAYNAIPTTTPLQLSGSLPGVGNPTFTSAAPNGGSDALSPSQSRSAFIAFIQSQSKATHTALVAAVQAVSSYLQLGSTFQAWDYATNIAVKGFTSAALLAQPGQIAIVYIDTTETGGQYTSGPGVAGDNTTADAILAAARATAGFGLTPVLYFANQYPVSFAAIAITVSNTQASAAGLATSTAALQGVVQTILTDLFAATGIAGDVPWSQVVKAILDYSVVNALGQTVTDIFTDVDLTASYLSVEKPTGGSYNVFSAVDTDVYPSSAGPAGALDPIGYLRVSATFDATGITFTVTP